MLKKVTRICSAVHPSKRFRYFSLLPVAILLSNILLPCVTAGAVGECRTECVEMNKYKIVRVRLADKVYAGVCRSIAQGSIVFPFFCEKEIGKWQLDLVDETGPQYFPFPCPPVEKVDSEKLEVCEIEPKSQELIEKDPVSLLGENFDVTNSVENVEGKKDKDAKEGEQ